MRWKNIAFYVVVFILMFFVCPYLISAPDDLFVITGVVLLVVYAYTLYAYLEKLYHQYQSRKNDV